MQLIVQGKGIEITDHLRKYVEKKVNKLDRYLSTISEVRVELSTENTRSYQDRQVAQLTIRTTGKGSIVRAEERTGDIFTSIDMVMDKIKRQIARYKRKRRDKSRSAPPEASAELEIEEIEVPEPGTVVRTKRFTLTPMNTDEAIEQMELLGHDFFVFYNVDESELNVLYRRRDGNYGLLQPEMA
jgi:putative sigma-54 modulation protein